MSEEKMAKDWLSLVPHGQLATRQWLLDQGVSAHTLDNAVKSRRLRVLARGVLARYEVPLTWQGVAASLNRMDGLVYVGGVSALSELGLAHYVGFAKEINLYSSEAPPSWLNKVGLEVELVWHRTRRLWNMSYLLQVGSLRKIEINDGYWLLASAEQAIFEVLVAVPNTYSFEYVDTLVQGMVNLSPRRLDAVLKASNHIKAKRLFFFFSDRYNYAWSKKIQPENYDLGTGKRSIVIGGKLDRKYSITIPEAFYG